MAKLKKEITAKVLFSYLVLLVLSVGVGYIIYAEINSYTAVREDSSRENDKIFRIGQVLTLLYESESFARSAIQSNQKDPYNTYLGKNDTIDAEIDTLKMLMDNQVQRALLDSVKILLDQKVENITKLRQIRNSNRSDRALEQAIAKFSKIEETLGRLSINDFVANPSSLTRERRYQLQEQIRILNRYIPRDSTNTVDEKTLDSLVISSLAMLEQIRDETRNQRLSATIEENLLLQNDLNTSQQLRQILTAFEKETMENSKLAGIDREKVLDRSITVLTWAAIIGIALVILFSLITLNDFLKSQRYREELEKANNYTASLLKSREQLISMVSHDLRTPLNTILGYTELLGNQSVSPKTSYYTDRIRSASTYVTKLVDDLLDYTRLEADKISVDPIPFNLNKLIRETAENVAAIYPEKRIALQMELADLHEKLLGDSFRIKQILTNLINNAFKYTEEGSITISTRLQNEQTLAIEVKDTGLGISEEKQQDIFKEFTQAEDWHERKFGGTGLGLFISKKLSGLLGGDLTLESAPGQGSAFTLFLPAKFSAVPLAEKPEENVTSEILTGKKVIVIDDDPLLLEMICDWLKNQNAQPLPFERATEALLQIKTLDYDLIITDIQLPGINGFRFLELLRSDASYGYRGQPVIAASGRKNLDREKYLRNGFSAFITKPYHPSALLQMISALFDKEAPGPSLSLSEKNKDVTSRPFSLADIRNFLNHDKEALSELLDTLVSTTLTDIEMLKKCAADSDLKTAQDLAHRMKTMFGQIHANELVQILEALEQQEVSDQEFEKKIMQFEQGFQQIKEQLMASA